MASGTGTWQTTADKYFLDGLRSSLQKMELYGVDAGAGLPTVLSDTLSVSWNVSVPNLIASLGDGVLFTITEPGTVSYIRFKNNSNVVTATIEITPIVYSTATYYTMTELSLEID